MILILEGPDGSGKSYLANYLTAKWSFSLIPTQGPPKSRGDLLHRMDRVISRDQPRERILSDRFALFSEQVYGPVIRDNCLLTEYDIQTYTRRLIRHNAVILYCRPSDETLAKVELEKKSHKDEDHVQRVKSQFSRITLVYDRVMHAASMSGLTVIKYNRDKTTTEDLFNVWISPLCGE